MVTSCSIERFLAEREHDEERRDRALLWILALLWRKPWYSKRRPVVAGAEYHARFDLFRQGRLFELVSWYNKDRGRLRSRLRRVSGAAPAPSEAAVVIGGSVCWALRRPSRPRPYSCSHWASRELSICLAPTRVDGTWHWKTRKGQGTWPQARRGRAGANNGQPRGCPGGPRRWLALLVRPHRPDSETPGCQCLVPDVLRRNCACTPADVF